MPSATRPIDADTSVRPVTLKWLAVLALALAAPAAFSLLAFRATEWPEALAPLAISQAWQARSDGDGGVKWLPAVLPFRCRDPGDVERPGEAPRDFCDETFRIIHHADAAAAESGGPLQSLYIPSFQGGLLVSLNGTFIASSRWRQSETGVATGVPIIIPLPYPMLQAGENVIEIALHRRGVANGYLDQVAIGPDQLLRADYDRRELLFSTFRRMIEGWQFALGLAMLLMWLTRPKEQAFLVFGVILALLSAQPLADLFVDAIDNPFMRLINMTRIMAGLLSLPMAWLFVGRKPPIPIWVFALPSLALAAMPFTLPLHVFKFILTVIIIPLTLTIAIVALWTIAKEALGKRDNAATLLMGGCFITLISGAHDWVVVRGDLGERSVLIGRLSAPIYLTAASGALIWRFGQALSVLDRLSARLRSDVAAAEDALRASFGREQAQERKTILESERVRLMSDLHDGIAGQLVSILALCELRGRDADEVTNSVRAALTDLRLVVASLEDVGDDLGVVLALFRERIEPQLAALGVRLTWRMTDLPETTGLHPGAALAIFRVLQEAVMNAARHSGASVVTLEAGPSPTPGCGVRLTVRDAGCGGVKERPGGYGLGNMRRRADSISGTLGVISDSSGTEITLDLPKSFHEAGHPSMM